eukprot:CAMPEP_0119088356 /NCGR_PEP_ID=MMETSP1178-20130426/145187_1 /TAXON_ID=33656 /ORGANISM="unid sp, Strain CCMP2000" /LENGTH=136 /DNA_ID=CAMNT_0007071635 /DNA_START=113 /DNA_END=520 /DNA_ORIENTATION=+
MTQLQEIRLYDEDDALLDIPALGATFENTGGASPNHQKIGNLFDSDVNECVCLYNAYKTPPHLMPAMYCYACASFTKGHKWLDFNSQVPCVDDQCDHDLDLATEKYFAIINIVLPYPIDITSYEFVTANDNPKRDP